MCYAAFQPGFWAPKSRLQSTTHDFVAFQASHAKLPERQELSVCFFYFYYIIINLIATLYCPKVYFSRVTLSLKNTASEGAAIVVSRAMWCQSAELGVHWSSTSSRVWLLFQCTFTGRRLKKHGLLGTQQKSLNYNEYYNKNSDKPYIVIVVS